jgi:magnesium chelatase family protein
LLDRIDLVVATQPVERAAMLADGARGESTAEVKARIAPAVERMRERLSGRGIAANAHVPGSWLKGSGPCGIRSEALTWLREASSRGRLSSRALDKVLRTAWTIADLSAVERPGIPEVAEAVALRDESFRVAA